MKHNFLSNVKRAFLSSAIAGALALSATAAFAEEQMSTEMAAKKANNPVSDVWMLITQNDYTAINGDATNGHSKMQERLSFQPVMPVPIFGGDWNLVNRVVLQAYDSPLDDSDSTLDPFDERTQGLGDTILFSMFAPNRDDGFIWGVGPSMIAPTATSKVLGQEKWQLGAAGLAVRLGKSHGDFNLESFNIGALAQHWVDVAGTENRAHTNQSDIQYFVNWKKDPVTLIGMTPNIQIDWKKEGKDRFSVPVGLGYIGMFKMGNTPVRWGVEIQKYVLQPDQYAPEWNLKFFIAPIKANPFK